MEPLSITKFKNINELLDAQASKRASDTLFIFPSQGQVISYGDFTIQVNNVANLLHACGIRKGDVISVVDHNSLEFLVIFFAALKIGAIICPLNYRGSPEQSFFILNDVGAKILFGRDRYLDEISTVLKQTRIEQIFSYPVLPTNFKCFEYEIEKSKMSDIFQSSVMTSGNEVAEILYTSGTTGKPKGVQLTHNNFLYEVAAVIEALRVTRDDVFMMANPLFHINAQVMTALAPIAAGASVVVNERFSASRFWNLMEKYHCTMTIVVPTMLAMLLNTPETASSYSLQSLRYIVVSSAPLPIELAKRFEELFVVDLIEMYGLTENTCMCTSNPPTLRERKLGSAGTALLSCEIKIVDDHGKGMPQNEIGEICIWGPIIMKGYYKQEEKTKETIKDGWLFSGDLGYLDEGGFLYVTGRKKDLIIKGGEKISPESIDNVLYMHEKVADAATIGIRDEIYGQEIESFVVRKDDTVSKDELLYHVRKRLNPFFCPKYITFVDHIPKGPTGKILRRELIHVSHQ